MPPQVWGRDEDDTSVLSFKQPDIDQIVEVKRHRGHYATISPMKQHHGLSILSLCVSDNNKQLLLNSEGFIPLLVDSLLLDPEHPRRDNATLMGTTDWETAKGPVQRVSADTVLVLSVQHDCSI